MSGLIGLGHIVHVAAVYSIILREEIGYQQVVQAQLTSNQPGFMLLLAPYMT